MTGSAVSYRNVIDNLQRFLDTGARLFPALRDREETLRAKLKALSAQEKNLGGALMILVLGGTGVGKSTVLNAIAREEELARTSEIRPTTLNTTFYAHEEAHLDAVNRIFRAKDNLRVHRSEGLEHKILIDPPDFDSTVRQNRERLREILDISDLVICTATVERYIDESFFDILGEFKDTKTFVFLLNKSDVIADIGKIKGDFAEYLGRGGFADERILTVSARAALAQRVGKGSPDDEGEFADLEGIITRELDRARIREIKEANIHNLVEHVISEMSACLPDNAEGAISAWLASLDSARADLAAALREDTRRSLHLSGRQISASLASLDVLAFRGPFGWYLAGVERLKNLLTLRGILSSGGDLLAMTENLSQRIRKHLDEENIEARFRQTIDRASAGLKDRGVHETTFRKRLPPESGLGVGHRAARVVTDLVAAKLSVAYDRALSRHWFSPANLLYNLPPLAFAAYVAYIVVTRYQQGDYVGTAFVIHSMLFLLLILGLEHQLSAKTSIARRTGKLLRSLEKEIEIRIGEFFDRMIAGPAAETADELKGVLSHLSGARAEHDKIKKR